MCVERGLLDYDEKVATYWPEFAAHGKGDATVAQLLSHQCGLIGPDVPVTLAEALDWKTITAMLADTKPDWPIGTAHGYHALTYGWLAGELIRRADGRSPGQFVADEIAGPLGVELWIGLPEEQEPRVSPIIGRLTEPDPIRTSGRCSRCSSARTPVAGRALFLNGAFAGDDVVQPTRRSRRGDPGCERHRHGCGLGQGLRGDDGARRRRAAAERRDPRSAPEPPSRPTVSPICA